MPVKAFFTSTSLAQQPTQLNPIDMVGTYLRTTLLGQGGISTDRAITMDAKVIDSSSLGFLDPTHTPEGGRSGISLHLALGVEKRGVEPTTVVWDVRSGRKVARTPAELANSTVGFADQFEEKGGKVTATRKTVTAIPPGGGDPTTVKASDVDYVLVSPRQMFSMAASLVPFLPSDQANRVGMATRHMEQSISLKYREPPLVQVVSGSEDPKTDTWEKLLGKSFSHNAPVSGTVAAVTKDKITILGDDKKKYDVQLYSNYPLNEKKAFLDSEPLVKVGDKVSRGDTVADTNSTRNGVLSIGKNLRIAYLPYRGLSVSGDSSVYWVDSDGRGHHGPIREVSPVAGVRTNALDPGTLRPVLHAMHSYIGHHTAEPMMRVETMEGLVVKATKSHSFITIADDGLLAEIAPEDMVPGRTLLPTVQPVVAFPEQADPLRLVPLRKAGGGTVVVPMDEDLGFILGMYVAEGNVNVRNGNPHDVCFAATEDVLVQRLVRVLGRWGLRGVVRTREDTRKDGGSALSGTVSVCSAALASF
ncbi:MAG: LAGLIDADG family homing endonuclease, partial [Myxococcota bacterium]